MALPYPEGECFFKRSALKSEKSGRFDAEDPAHFYSTMIIEMVWNKEAHHGSKEANSPHGHPHNRSGYQIFPSRRVQHELCTSGARFKARERGGSAEAWFMFVPMPTREEEWVWMDRLTCVRAIYIPAAYHAGPKYQDLCTYIHFASAGSVTKETRTIRCNKTWGVDVDDTTALGINPARLITALSIPRGSRKVDALSSKAVVLTDSEDIPNATLEMEFDDNCMADWAVVVSKNQGLRIKWEEGDMSSHWFVEYFRNAIGFAIGYVPLVGPFLAIGWNVATAAIIYDSEGFMNELRGQVPSYRLLEGLFNEIKAIAAEAKPMLADSALSRKPVKEPDSVVFDTETLAEAQKVVAAKAEAEIDNGADEKEQSVFHTLGPSLVLQLAFVNRVALLSLLQEPPEPEPFAQYAHTHGSESCMSELPFGDTDELANLLARLSKKRKVHFPEDMKLTDMPKNKYGGDEYYMKSKEEQFIEEKK
ncbi:hypothetical protein BJX61DRAFT_552185 [Aspergillus egyptiacus]|nr:hypothetical protein BJX61DRAFT_552185 [Aspergillus egyptiacus]